MRQGRRYAQSTSSLQADNAGLVVIRHRLKPDTLVFGRTTWEPERYTRCMLHVDPRFYQQRSSSNLHLKVVVVLTLKAPFHFQPRLNLGVEQAYIIVIGSLQQVEIKHADQPVGPRQTDAAEIKRAEMVLDPFPRRSRALIRTGHTTMREIQPASHQRDPAKHIATRIGTLKSLDQGGIAAAHSGEHVGKDRVTTECRNLVRVPAASRTMHVAGLGRAEPRRFAQ